MKRDVALKIADVQNRAATDRGYLSLWEEYRRISPKLLNLLEKLPGEEASVIEDYLGVTAEMHRFLLELACE